jgi:hypothetical protein
MCTEAVAVVRAVGADFQNSDSLHIIFTFFPLVRMFVAFVS